MEPGTLSVAGLLGEPAAVEVSGTRHAAWPPAWPPAWLAERQTKEKVKKGNLRSLLQDTRLATCVEALQTDRHVLASDDAHLPEMGEGRPCCLSRPPWPVLTRAVSPKAKPQNDNEAVVYCKYGCGTSSSLAIAAFRPRLGLSKPAQAKWCTRRACACGWSTAAAVYIARYVREEGSSEENRFSARC
eukprot:scaffold7328_cov314-Pinguiococcus_pyrenoidosus.AAC.34